MRFDSRIEICTGVKFVKIDGAFVQPLIKKTDPTVLVAAALAYNVKKPTIQQDPWLRR
jgi:hypothetical protein